jgi:serpin B
MTIFLPKYNIELNSVISQLNRTNLQSWLSSFTSSKVILLMPKFELGYKLQMNDVLKSMGMEIAFSGNADFTNMFKPGGLFISEVMHKSYLKVDEVGTEAAAVTSVGVGRSIGNPGFYMKVNKPFLFVIRERNSNSILFMGKVVSL